MCNNIHLVEEYQRVQNPKGRIIQYACKYNVLEVLQSPRRMNLSRYVLIIDWDYLLESRLILKVLPVIRFVVRELLVVYSQLVPDITKRGMCARSYTPRPQQLPKPYHRSPSTLLFVCHSTELASS